MTTERIAKDPSALKAEPNLTEAGRGSFTFAAAEALVPRPADGSLNITYAAVDHHAAGDKKDHPALVWLARGWTGGDAGREVLTYGDLAEQTARFANVLESLGVKAGDRVFGLMGRVPELYVAALGTLKHKSVFSPLFSAFGPEPIKQRMNLGDAKVLVTSDRLYRRKVKKIRDEIPSLEHVLLVSESGEPTDVEGTHDLRALLKDASPDFVLPKTDAEDMALLHFTSGTTGTPKGAVHVHNAVVWHHASGRFALDLHDDDVFWCTADPGWVTGTSYGIIAPLTCGVTMLVDEAEFDAERWLTILEKEQVSVWYTAPTAVRMMMKLGDDIAKARDLGKLRFIASVGEPLNPEAVRWGLEAFGLPIHDNWWQTETGGIMIANTADMDIKPGSMGRPLPGVEACVVEKNDDGTVRVLEGAGEEGELALRPGWPSMMRGYLHAEERYQKAFTTDSNGARLYLSGDLAKIDDEGYVWFVGRADDVIKSAGHLIGPFEVESVLIEHPAVAEAGVIGKPDDVAGNIIKAFLALKPGFEESPELEKEIMALARKRLGAAVAPRELAFVDDLPKTRSGKIMRRLLKARELGLDEGDTSTLLTPASADDGASDQNGEN